jgi:hypothetical protein
VQVRLAPRRAFVVVWRVCWWGVWYSTLLIIGHVVGVLKRCHWLALHEFLMGFGVGDGITVPECVLHWGRNRVGRRMCGHEVVNTMGRREIPDDLVHLPRISDGNEGCWKGGGNCEWGRAEAYLRRVWRIQVPPGGGRAAGCCCSWVLRLGAWLERRSFLGGPWWSAVRVFAEESLDCPMVRVVLDEEVRTGDVRVEPVFVWVALRDR